MTTGRNLGTIYYTVAAETGRLLSAERDVSTATARMSQRFRETDGAAAQLSAGMNKLAAAIKLVIAASAVREMARMVQGYQEMAERVQMATSSQAEYEMVQQRLLATANGTYRALSEAQELYIRTADSLRSMGYSTAQAVDIQDSMSYAFVRNATSADRAEAAISAFSKSVNTGKVAADQWETMAAAIPSVITDIAEASGKSAAEVRALGAAGKLTAQDLTEGLRKSLEGNAAAAAKMAANLTDAGVRMRTGLTSVLVGLERESGALQSFTDGLLSLGNAMISFGEDADSIRSLLDAATTAFDAATIAGAAYGSVMAGRIIMSLAAYTADQAKAVSATLSKVAADRAVIQSSLHKAAVEKAGAAAALLVAQAEFQAARGSNAHAIASAALAAAVQRNHVALIAYTAAQNAANASAAIGVAVAGKLRAAMAFLGGPVGVVLLAATAIYAFSSSAKDAKPSVDELTSSVGDLGTEMLKLRKINIGDQIAELEKLASQMQRNIDYSDRLMAAGDESAKTGRHMRRYQEERAELEKTRAQIDALKTARVAADAELEKRASTSGTSVGKGPSQNDPESEKRLAAMRQELELSKRIGVERAKLAAIQSLGDGASASQKAEAEQLAASIYGLEQARKRAEESARAQKSADDDAKKLVEDNAKAVADLRQELELAALAGEDLAVAQARARLNSAATPEQIAQVEELARANWTLARSKEALSNLRQADPIANEQARYLEQLQSYQSLKEQQYLTDQRYLELKAQAEVAHDEQMRVLQEENLRRQSQGYDILFGALGRLETASADALTGLITGATSGQEVMQQLGNAILRDAVGALTKMGIEYVRNAVLRQAMASTEMAAIASTTAAQAAATATTTATTVAAAGTITAAAAPAAGMMSIATMGKAALIGGAALAATMAIAKSFGGGRQYGGPVDASGLYRINENGRPEVFQAANGQQYMLPNTRGEVVSNKDATAKQGPTNVVNIINQSSAVIEQKQTQLPNGGQQTDVLIRDLHSDGNFSRTLQQTFGLRRQGR